MHNPGLSHASTLSLCSIMQVMQVSSLTSYSGRYRSHFSNPSIHQIRTLRPRPSAFSQRINKRAWHLSKTKSCKFSLPSMARLRQLNSTLRLSNSVKPTLCEYFSVSRVRTATRKPFCKRVALSEFRFL